MRMDSVQDVLSLNNMERLNKWALNYDLSTKTYIKSVDVHKNHLIVRTFSTMLGLYVTKLRRKTC